MTAQLSTVMCVCGGVSFQVLDSCIARHIEGGNRTGSILKAGLHLGLDCGL